MPTPFPGGPDPEAPAAEPDAGLLEAGAAAGRRRRAAGRRRALGLAGVGLLGACAGAVGAVAALPGLRARAEGLPSIRTVAQPTADAQSPAATVYRVLGPSVVLVENEQAAGQNFFSGPGVTDWGSGVIISASGYIVTNDHVVENASQITVTLADGTSYPATLVGGDPSTDLAVIRVNPREALQPATFADSAAVQVGQTAIAIGNPLGPEFQESVDQGIVSAVRPMLYGLTSQQERVTTMIQTDAPVNPGNSGGPLANAQGQVIGIVSEKTVSTGERGVQAVGLGFAIPSDTVARVANELVRYGYYKWPWLGITLSGQLSQVLPTEPQTLTITGVEPGGPSAGRLQAGDVITSWNGQPVVNYDDLVADISRAEPGQTVRIGVRRGGRSLTVDVTLGTEPESEAKGQQNASAQPGGGGTSGGFPGIVIPGG
jgi:S1-C subfamily serine protease